MFVLPLVFVPFIISFPAGLVLYWITTNVWTIGQQFVVKRVLPAPHAGRRPSEASRRRSRRRRRRARRSAA